MDADQAKCRKIVGLCVVSLQILIIMVAQLAPYIDEKYRIALVVFSTLIGFITYTHTAYSLIKVLNQNDKEGFQKEIRHVKIQCIGYYVSVLLYSMFYMFEFSNIFKKDDRSKYIFLSLSLLLACNLIPPLFFLFMHHRIYTE